MNVGEARPPFFFFFFLLLCLFDDVCVAPDMTFVLDWASIIHQSIVPGPLERSWASLWEAQGDFQLSSLWCTLPDQATVVATVTAVDTN